MESSWHSGQFGVLTVSLLELLSSRMTSLSIRLNALPMRSKESGRLHTGSQTTRLPRSSGVNF